MSERWVNYGPICSCVSLSESKSSSRRSRTYIQLSSPVSVFTFNYLLSCKDSQALCESLVNIKNTSTWIVTLKSKWWHVKLTGGVAEDRGREQVSLICIWICKQNQFVLRHCNLEPSNWYFWREINFLFTNSQTRKTLLGNLLTKTFKVPFVSRTFVSEKYPK